LILEGWESKAKNAKEKDLRDAEDLIYSFEEYRKELDSSDLSGYLEEGIQHTDDGQRLPDLPPTPEHGGGAIISLPVKKPHRSIRALIPSRFPRVPSRRRRRSGLK
jgi:hypothetical protein